MERNQVFEIFSLLLLLVNLLCYTDYLHTVDDTQIISISTVLLIYRTYRPIHHLVSFVVHRTLEDNFPTSSKWPSQEKSERNILNIIDTESRKTETKCMFILSFA